MTRFKGSGSIYQRADGQWCVSIEMGIVDGKRKRKVITRKDHWRAVEIFEAHTAGAETKKTRAEYMQAARAIATHTASEWRAKVKASPKTCRYCDTDLNLFNMVKDHMIAVESGGSDGIDNLQPICWECNMEKRTTHHDEYVFKGDKPRPFTVLPIRRNQYEQLIAVRDRLRAEA